MESFLSPRQYTRIQLLEADASDSAVTNRILDKHFPDFQVKPQVSVRFTEFMSMVILLNTLQLGARCQWDEHEHPSLATIYTISEVFFLVCYVFEIILKVKIHGMKVYFTGPEIWFWNSSDFALTLLMAVQFCGQRVAQMEGLQPNTHDARLIRMTRVFRVARIFRIFSIFREVPDLTIVLEGVSKSLRPLGWIVLLLVLVIYAFGMFFTIAVLPDSFEQGNPFTSLFSSMKTLTAILVGDLWSDVVNPVAARQPILASVFYIFVILTVYGLANLIVGVICDATSATKHRLEWQQRREVLKKLSDAWLKNVRGQSLSVSDLSRLEGQELKDKKAERQTVVMEVLDNILSTHSVGFPPGVTAKNIFDMLDQEGDGELDHAEFITGLGNILLADNYQISCKHLLNAGRFRRKAFEEEGRAKKRAEDFEKKVAAVEKQVARCQEQLGRMEKQAASTQEDLGRIEKSTQEQLGRIEQQLATLLGKLDSR
mmetsp:Transcript_49292/g.89059  ORF Transcript_49292/g.89059 Transcript_49292/m.89059 type:complete len:485 (+) Transcript_49292:66-1520(+)